MAGWIILGIIVALITGFNLIRVGADLGYEGGVLRVSAKAAGLMLQLLPKEDKGEKKPKKEKPPKKKKEKKEPEPESGEAPKKKGLPLGMNTDELFTLVRKVLKLLSRFPGKFRIDRFMLHVCVAGGDPYDTAMTYAYLNEAISILIPLARRSFTVKESDVRTDVDFTAEELFFEVGLGLSIRIGQIVGLVLAIAFAGAKIVIKSKLRQKKEARQARREEQKQETETQATEIEAEERTESNG